MMLIGDSFPKVSCLMVTADGRLEQFYRSFDCYCAQTYPNRELLVVNEGSSDYQKRISEYVGVRNDVRLIFLEGDYTLGALRNISVALCSGEVFVQWDDDDFNMPERISVQFSDFSKHPEAKASFLGEQLHYYFTDGKLYWNSWARNNSGRRKEYSLIPGTIMAWKDRFKLRYPSGGPNSRTGEDSVVAFRLLREDVSVRILEGFGHMHVYSYHGKNVWDIEHHQKISRDRSEPVCFLLENRSRIEEAIRTLSLDGPVHVTGRDGHAFMSEVR